VGSALIHKGFKASPDQFIGIFSQNRPEVLTNHSALTVQGFEISNHGYKSQSSHLLTLESRFCGAFSAESMAFCYALESYTEDALDMISYTCNPSYLRGRGRRIILQGQPVPKKKS
jgi:hypothetical protein